MGKKGNAETGRRPLRELLPGDVVVLKSGGPEMVISDIGTHDGVRRRPVKCVFFVEARLHEVVVDYALLSWIR